MRRCFVVIFLLFVRRTGAFAQTAGGRAFLRGFALVPRRASVRLFRRLLRRIGFFVTSEKNRRISLRLKT